MRHRDEVLALLKKQIGNAQEVAEIGATAAEVAMHWVNPISGGKESTNGLVYGLVQSGKTGVLSVSGALGADEGYRTLIILTSDNDTLYDQTLGRVQEAFPGMEVLGKPDIKDQGAFTQRIKSGVTAIVITKNASMLETLVENFKKANVRGLSCLIIDDEADQASMNTFARKNNGQVSRINELILECRGFFDKNTYLQVTATPQCLFLQEPGHEFRPKFTILSHPGSDYVGGDEFFGEASTLVRRFPLTDISLIAPGPQPSPALTLPASLALALDTFMVAATYKRRSEPDQNCAFLCHVSTRKDDHKHIEKLLRRYKVDLIEGLKANDKGTVEPLRTAYEDLAKSHPGLGEIGFAPLLESMAFYSAGMAVKLVNGETDEDVAVKAPYNLFVGGHKLGRGVTIKNLLVSYYGRNPKTPQADTVLQHARMYGYRRKDIGLLRLFLPPELHTVFKAIHKMEVNLRKLIADHKAEGFRGIFLSDGVQATRKTVLAPGAIGIYTGGNNLNPAQVARDKSVVANTNKINAIVAHINDRTFREMPIKEMQELVRLTKVDDSKAEFVWRTDVVAMALEEWGKAFESETGYVYVCRERDLNAVRRETAGVLEGNELSAVPPGKVTLFLLRTVAKSGQQSAWWPQVRFPDGRYGFAFAV